MFEAKNLDLCEFWHPNYEGSNVGKIILPKSSDWTTSYPVGNYRVTIVASESVNLIRSLSAQPPAHA